MAEKQRVLRPEDLLTFDAFKLWLASLPNDFMFFDGLTTSSCPLAKFAQSVFPSGVWIANGLSLRWHRGIDDIVAEVRLEGEFTRMVPQLSDKAFAGRRNVCAAEVRMALPQLLPDNVVMFPRPYERKF